MRSKGRRGRALLVLLLAVTCLGLLRQGILALQQAVPSVAAQAALIEREALAPSTLFYSEIPLALRAEKQVRRQLAADRASQRVAESSRDNAVLIQ